MSKEYQHESVLLEECMAALNLQGGTVIDCTLGGGGHTAAILERSRCSVVGIDRDKDAIAAASERLKDFGSRFRAVQGSFFNIGQIVRSEGIENITGILADLGVSSFQLDNEERGFSYMADAPLDMRMDQRQDFRAYDVVNGYAEQELSKVIKTYGEEQWASRIAQFIVRERQKAPIRSSHELVEVIKAAVPASARRSGPHPAKRTFQALRIEVNCELEGLQGALEDMMASLQAGGRLVVITFHSLEDRIVKQTFARFVNPCTCPPKAPVCICGKKPVGKHITRKPITAGEEELEMNPRARSAKMRCVEKLGE